MTYSMNRTRGGGAAADGGLLGFRGLELTYQWALAVPLYLDTSTYLWRMLEDLGHLLIKCDVFVRTIQKGFTTCSVLVVLNKYQ